MKGLRRTAGLAIVLLVSACMSRWGWRPVDPEAPISARDSVWIWTKGGAVQWRRVFVTRDSVWGIPLVTWCSTCFRSIARAQVDSMKVRYTKHNPTGPEFIGVVVGALLVEAMVCSVIAPHDRQC